MVSKIIHGDSIEIIKKFPSSSIHAIISDIPYGIGLEDWDILHNNTNTAFCGTSQAQLKAGKIFKRRGKPLNGWSDADKQIPLEYQKWCSTWASEWLRILKPGATCFIFAGRRFAHRCICSLEDAGFTFKDELAWEKNFAPHRAQHLSAIFSRRKDSANEKKWENWRVANLRPLFEPILWFQKPYKIGTTITDNTLEHQVGAWNETALYKYNHHVDPSAVVSNIIKVNYNAEDRGKHPAQKPMKLMELLITLVTLENQIILDPFMGSGTTCVAAKKLNRRFIGIDIDAESINIAQTRLESIDNMLLLPIN